MEIWENVSRSEEKVVPLELHHSIRFASFSAFDLSHLDERLLRRRIVSKNVPKRIQDEIREPFITRESSRRTMLVAASTLFPTIFSDLFSIDQFGSRSEMAREGAYSFVIDSNRVDLGTRTSSSAH